MEFENLDILKAKERGDEAQFFRRWDEELLRKLREHAKLEEMTRALGQKLAVEDPGLLARAVAQGVSPETGPAFLLAPLVQIAWAEGKVTEAEREVILAIASERGIVPGTPSHARLHEWLEHRPSDLLFETSEACLRLGLGVLPPAERAERIGQLVAMCRRVAAASGGSKLARFLGLAHSVSPEEETVLAAITARLAP
ncbi:MAG: hypothetical protein MUC69_00210 [Gemmatimonadales bacterium]|jgi:hypothetical protein|nr:hypothetical protein [Gemmatimonadales bacterium]